MKFSLKRMVSVAFLAFALVNLVGCGEGTNTPSTPLTASTVSSNPPTNLVDSHTHSVSIPFSDLGGGKTVNYRSSVTSGHSHVIALSAGQLADLYNGLRVQVVSTPAADGHTHLWNILGGQIVYESICYNCHSNDKRGVSQMNSSQPPLQSQKNALQSPPTQPLSSAVSATPDPNFGTTAQTLTITTPSLTGAVVGTFHSQSLSATGGTSPYVWSITGYHPAWLALSAGGVISGTPTATDTGNYTLTVKVTDSATPAATASGSFTLGVTAVAPAIDGAALYASYCAGCHGALAGSRKRGKSAAQITSALATVPDMSGISLTAAQIQAVATALYP